MSSPPTREELLSMAFLGQENFTPAAEERQQPRFLSLAPTTSTSYPPTPSVKSPAPQSPATETPNTLGMPSAAVIDEALKTRRSSSLSSDGSNQKRRFLKLGPVHFGEGGKNDWSEEVVDE